MIFNKVCVYGGGLIGSAWATNFLMKGVEVNLYDLKEELVQAAKDGVKQRLDFFAEPSIGVLTPEQVTDCMNRLHVTTDVKTAVEGVGFIQENGPENSAIKRSIIKAIEEHNSTAIIATSSSGLLISDIAAEAQHPERIIGGHPYNPVHLIPLVELARGEKTEQAAIDKACQFYKEVGKEPVVLQKECLGFICNRIQMALNRESYDLVYRGVCSVEDVDKAVTFGPGLRWGLMGPHLCGELGGGKGGIRGIMTHIGPTTQAWLEDMAKWTRSPEDYVDIAEAGVAAELANRPAEQGNTHDSLERFRDEGLVNLLKFHGKL